ncbi:MAG: hypothetical protein R3C68_09180 [Myxococcota bacterium]
MQEVRKPAAIAVKSPTTAPNAPNLDQDKFPRLEDDANPQWKIRNHFGWTEKAFWVAAAVKEMGFPAILAFPFVCLVGCIAAVIEFITWPISAIFKAEATGKANLTRQFVDQILFPSRRQNSPRQ